MLHGVLDELIHVRTDSLDTSLHGRNSVALSGAPNANSHFCTEQLIRYTRSPSAMRGEIDFKESFTRRVALLKGLDESVKQDIIDHLPITEGADRLFSVLKRCGFKIAILSGGFTFVGKYLQERFGVDYVYANTLEVEDGKFTGRYIGDVVDAKRKAELLELIAQVEHIDLAQVIAVGDGANDLNMLGKAGLGIAFHAKPKVKENARQAISTVGLDGILYFLGFKDAFLK